jgi:hypothetical protein
MKQFARVLTAVFFATAVMAAYAGPQECKEPPGQMKEKNKPSKVTILHCGCTDAGDVMEYVEIQVSSKSRGHLRHVGGSYASCSDGSDTYVDFIRTGSDCQVDDGTAKLDGLEFCNDKQFPMAECGDLSKDG